MIEIVITAVVSSVVTCSCILCTDKLIDIYYMYKNRIPSFRPGATTMTDSRRCYDDINRYFTLDGDENNNDGGGVDDRSI